MPKLRSATVATALAVLAGNAPLSWAQETEQTTASGPYSNPYSPYSGLYVGVGWGRFNPNLDNLNAVGTTVNSIVHSGDNDAFKADLGWRVSPYFAIEGDYMNFGTATNAFYGTGSSGNYRLHMSGFAPFVVGTLPAGPFELFAKAGWLFYNSDLRVNLNAPGTEVLESTHSNSDFIWGGGLGITFFRHLNVSAEYDQIRLNDASHSNAVWLNASWRF